MNPALFIPAERSASGFEIREKSNATIQVTLWGDLGLGWFGRLSTALARRGLSIQSAQAIRTMDDDWTGTLELFSDTATVEPRALDFLALSREQPVGKNPEPAFQHFRLERTSVGALELRFSAEDRIGLLSALLDHLEFLGLFPEELRVTTQDKHVEDTLWLRGVAGNGPSAQAEEALRHWMSRSTRPSNG